MTRHKPSYSKNPPYFFKDSKWTARNVGTFSGQRVRINHEKQEWVEATFKRYCMENDVAAVRALAKRYDLRRFIEINMCLVAVPKREYGFPYMSDYTVLLQACYCDHDELVELILDIFGDQVERHQYISALCMALVSKGPFKLCMHLLLQSPLVRNAILCTRKYAYNSEKRHQVAYYILESRSVDFMRILNGLDEAYIAFFPPLQRCVAQQWTEGILYLCSIGYFLSATFVSNSAWCKVLDLEYVSKLAMDGTLTICGSDLGSKIDVFSLLYNIDNGSKRDDFEALKPILLYLKSMGQEFHRCTSEETSCKCRKLGDWLCGYFPGIPSSDILFLMENGIWEERSGGEVEVDGTIAALNRRWKLRLLCMTSTPPHQASLSVATAPPIYRAFFNHSSFERNLISTIGDFL